MRAIALSFVLFFAGCASNNEPIVIRKPKSDPQMAPQMAPQQETPASAFTPKTLDGVKYYMISEQDIAKYVAAMNKMKEQNEKLYAAARAKSNAEVVNTQPVVPVEPAPESSMVNEFGLNTPLLSIDDLATLPITLPAIEPEKESDWNWADYLFTVMFIAGLTLAICGHYKRKKELKLRAQNSAPKVENGA